MEFLKQIDEARLLRNTSQMEVQGAEGLVQTAILELSNLVMFQHDKTAQQYAAQTLQGNFNNWRVSGTDLHNAVAALNNPDYRKRLGITHGVPNVLLLQKILRDAQRGQALATDFNKFAMSLQRDLGISSTALTTIRRRVADYGLLNATQQSQLSGDIAKAYGSQFGSSEVAVIKRSKASSALRSLGMWAAITAGAAYGGYQVGKALSK